MPKAYGSRVQLDQVAFVIRQKPEAPETPNELQTPSGNVSAGTWNDHNVSCAMRKRFYHVIIIVFP
jgi:hypothetical protein